MQRNRARLFQVADLHAHPCDDSEDLITPCVLRPVEIWRVVFTLICDPHGNVVTKISQLLRYSYRTVELRFW